MSIVVTALLATVIFVLVQIAICKYHQKFRQCFKFKRAEASTSAGECEPREYYEVVESEGEATPTPERIDKAERVINIKKNTAYETN